MFQLKQTWFQGKPDLLQFLATNPTRTSSNKHVSSLKRQNNISFKRQDSCMQMGIEYNFNVNTLDWFQQYNIVQVDIPIDVEMMIPANDDVGIINNEQDANDVIPENVVEPGAFRLELINVNNVLRGGGGYSSRWCHKGRASSSRCR